MEWIGRGLTVPLLCSGCRFEVEGLHQVQRRVAQTLVMNGGPQVDHVPVFPAAGVKAVEHLLVEVDAERCPRPRSQVNAPGEVRRPVIRPLAGA